MLLATISKKIKKKPANVYMFTCHATVLLVTTNMLPFILSHAVPEDN
jgi:hypothetical protein